MPTGVYQSKNRKGGQKGKSGVYPKSEEHKKRISETLKRLGLKPPLTISRYWLGKSRSEETKRKIGLAAQGRKASDETKLKMSEMRKGENHWHWKEDRSTLAKKQMRNDSAYANWRNEVKKRDGECRMKNENCLGYLVVHHILGWSNFPDERYNVNNGITLCQAHHPRKRAEEKRLVPFLQRLVTNKN